LPAKDAQFSAVLADAARPKGRRTSSTTPASPTTDPQGGVWANDIGCDVMVYRRYADADARPVLDRWEARLSAFVGLGIGFYNAAYMPDGTAFYSTYPNEIYRVLPGGAPELFATQALSNGGVGLQYDDATGKLYAFAADGLWSFHLRPERVPTLSFSGTCPGPMTLNLSGMTPNGPIKVVSSSQTGAVAVPAGPCAGSVSGLGLSNLRLRANLTADAAGDASLSVTLPGAACAAYVQVLDGDSCTFTEVVQP